MGTVYFKRHINNGVRFVMVYKDENCTLLRCIINSTVSSLPNKRRKNIIINGLKYNCRFATLTT